MKSTGETTSTPPTARTASATTLIRFGLWIVWSTDATRVGRRLDVPTATMVIGRDEPCHVVLADRWLSRRHLALSSEGPRALVVKDLGTRNGTWVNGRRVERARLNPGDLVRAGATLFIAADGFDPDRCHLGLVGLSAELAQVRESIATLAPASLIKTAGADLETISLPQPVHITGETGVGKELVAGALHRLSRRTGPFITRNMATVPRDLVATELFGHSRGAFTGADRDRAGLFQAADAGTLFLDEIAETPDVVQASMLTVLDSGNFMPVGSARAVRVDVRTVTATHRDLAQLVSEGRFRKDLFHRLTTATISIPPLRSRRLDVPILAAHFLQLGTSALALMRTSATAMFWMADALEALHQSPWPGNVRQLQGWIGHVCGLVARGLPTEESPWPDPTRFAAMVPVRGHIEADFAPEVAPFPAPELTPTAHIDDSGEASQLFIDAETLQGVLIGRFGGNVAAFARWAAPRLGLRESAVRRKIYYVLGPERVAALRGRGAE